MQREIGIGGSGIVESKAGLSGGSAQPQADQVGIQLLWALQADLDGG